MYPIGTSRPLQISYDGYFEVFVTSAPSADARRAWVPIEGELSFNALHAKCDGRGMAYGATEETLMQDRPSPRLT